VLPAVVICGEYGRVALTLVQEWRWCTCYAFGVRGYMLVPVTVYYYHTILQQMIDDSSMLCYHEGLETKCKLDTAIELC
jgi:hypothetical protein